MYWYHYYKSMFTAVLIFVFKYNVEAKVSFAGCTAFIEVLKASYMKLLTATRLNKLVTIPFAF